MKYKVLLSKKSNSFLEKLEKSDKERVKNKLRQLSDNPELGKPLVGKLSSLWSLRIGIYRVINQIRKNELVVLVLKIGHRERVY